jgi:hypothetical protein
MIKKKKNDTDRVKSTLQRTVHKTWLRKRIKKCNFYRKWQPRRKKLEKIEEKIVIKVSFSLASTRALLSLTLYIGLFIVSFQLLPISHVRYFSNLTVFLFRKRLIHSLIHSFIRSVICFIYSITCMCACVIRTNDRITKMKIKNERNVKKRTRNH